MTTTTTTTTFFDNNNTQPSNGKIEKMRFVITATLTTNLATLTLTTNHAMVQTVNVTVGVAANPSNNNNTSIGTTSSSCKIIT